MTGQFPQVLAGRYELREVIGRGGMAEVRLGYDTRLSRMIAIKLLRSDIAGDATFQARFRREAQSAAALNHPAIVAVYDSGEEELTLQRVARLEVPIVFVDRAPRGPAVDCVTSDTRAASERATAHLLQRGHRRIVLLTERLHVATAVERRQGFLDAYATAGADASQALVLSGLVGARVARSALLEAMSAEHPPTAVFSGQNLLTEGAVQALNELGLRRSVAHVGFDDLPLADVLDPGLTVVRQDPQTMGRLAAERLFARMAGAVTGPEHLVLPTELVCRGSGEIPGPLPHRPAL